MNSCFVGDAQILIWLRCLESHFTNYLFGVELVNIEFFNEENSVIPVISIISVIHTIPISGVRTKIIVNCERFKCCP